MTDRVKIARGVAALALVLALLADRGEAHPHIWIDAHSTVVVEAAELVAVRHRWTFDRMFSAQAVAELRPAASGAYDAASLQPLADLYAQTLPPWGYFTEVRTEGAATPALAARPMWLEHDGQRLTLHLDLEVSPPLPLAELDQVRVHDRTFFVAIAYRGEASAMVEGAPGCRLFLHRPGQLDPALLARLEAVPASSRELPPELASHVRDAAHRLELACGED